VLPPDAMEQLRELAAQVRGRPKVYEVWGFGPRLTRGRGITALFTGPSGTGKTLAAEVLAAELGLDLLRVDLAGVVDKYIGETEKRIRDVFDSCERCGGILFCDEADALFGRRTEVRDSHDRYANIEVDYLLQRMEAYDGVAILATNRRSAIDRAFLRRLRFVIEFPFPDPEYRRRIWQISFPAAAERGELDLAHLARLELSGGNIRTIAINAAFLAAAESEPIGMAHVLRAARREYAKLEKPFGPAELGRYRIGKAARHA
jgi:SpoVK/Ycf46/Vps4 family AAA+-type ATPase